MLRAGSRANKVEHRDRLLAKRKAAYARTTQRRAQAASDDRSHRSPQWSSREMAQSVMPCPMLAFPPHTPRQTWNVNTRECAYRSCCIALLIPRPTARCALQVALTVSRTIAQRGLSARKLPQKTVNGVQSTKCCRSVRANDVLFIARLALTAAVLTGQAAQIVQTTHISHRSFRR